MCYNSVKIGAVLFTITFVGKHHKSFEVYKIQAWKPLFHRKIRGKKMTASSFQVFPDIFELYGIPMLENFSKC